MSLGGAIFVGNSKLFSGPLGVVKIGFKGYDLGKTTAGSTLTPDQDIKDIMYQQEGTKPADHVRTGMEYLLDVTFGEIKTGLLALLMAGISAGEDAGDDDGIIGRDIFQSMLDNEAGVLKIAACDENGIALEDTENVMNWYEGIPVITGELVNWGVDTQRNLPVQFRLKYHTFTAVELAALTRTSGGAYGYFGDPADTAVDCTPVVWPDKEAPEIVSAIAGDANTLTVTFDELIDFFEDGTFEATHYSMKINGAYVAPTAGVITGAGIALTFTGAFTDGNDVIYISITEDEIEDEATPPENVFPGVSLFPCTPWAG